MNKLDVVYPFTGRWLVQNSPAERLPSHGTPAFASSHAIDFVPLPETGRRTAPITARALIGTEAPERFPGFGRAILSPVSGTVVVALDGEPDHVAHRGLASIGYALTQRQRVAQGWPTLAGNHVFIAVDANEDDQPAVIALCHLRENSLVVRVGDIVRQGDPIAQCGNSGNSTEPHLHIQAMSTVDVDRARAVPLRFRATLPRNGTIVVG